MLQSILSPISIQNNGTITRKRVRNQGRIFTKKERVAENEEMKKERKFANNTK